MCKYYLCGLDITCFKNTRSDGDVARWVPAQSFTKLRDDDVKAAFQALSDEAKAKLGYERDTKAVLDNLVRDCDRRVERGLARARVERERAQVMISTSADNDVLELLKVKMKESTEKAEKLGEDGDVDGAEKELEHLETLKQRADEVKLKMENMQHVKLTETCRVSGTLMSTTDNDQRRQDHFTGKQYQGWLHIRTLRDDLEKRLKMYEEAGYDSGHPRASDDARDRRGSGGRGYDRGRGSDRRSRSRSRSRERYDRNCTNRFGRDRDRSRSRDRDRGYRQEPYRRNEDRFRDDRRRDDRHRDDRRRDDRYTR